MRGSTMSSSINSAFNKNYLLLNTNTNTLENG